MSLLSRLFGGGASAHEVEPTAYKGYAIYPEPIREGPRFRIAARIEKEVDGQTKSHQLIRADTHEDQGSANEASVRKAKQMIDEQGDAIF